MIAWVYLEDECPRIGCGWRRLEIRRGRKWLRLRECATGVRARLPAAMLDKLAPRFT